MSTTEAVRYIWDAKLLLAPWVLGAFFIASCAVPDYMRREQRSRIRFLYGLAAFTAALFFPSFLRGVFSAKPFWDAVLLSGGRARGGLFWGLLCLVACVAFAFGELAARERARKHSGQMRSNSSSS